MTHLLNIKNMPFYLRRGAIYYFSIIVSGDRYLRRLWLDGVSLCRVIAWVTSITYC